MGATELVGYSYVVLRCVPRVDRGEFINVGVVVYCQAREYLQARCHLDTDRLRALDTNLDVAATRAALAAVDDVCTGATAAGEVAGAPLGTRFGFLTAPRSTVIQPGPVHGGLTTDPDTALATLLDALVRS
ncbi:MAG TPA: DUF3037 domain-containing protein [Nocardioidaceae bacterium]|nr:DUF3037 domain-containing protein [Nocardioidaceae bacterium]